MKGTIDARVPDAERVILEDYKERAEHYTIVDLIRNDLNRVAGNVRVPVSVILIACIQAMARCCK